MDSRKLLSLTLVVALPLVAAVVAGQTQPSHPGLSGKWNLIDGNSRLGSSPLQSGGSISLLLLTQLGTRPQNATISGKLTLIDGRDAAGIRVTAMVVDELSPGNAIPALVGLTQADATGQYRLDNVPPGRYFIMAGLTDSPSFYPGVRSISGARVVTVTSAATVRGIDFSVVPAGAAHVRGKVSGVPSTIPRAIATVYLDSSMGRLVAAIESDGTFEFSGVSSGAYRISTAVQSAGLPRSVIVADGDVTGVNLRLPPFLFGHVVVDDGSELPVDPRLLSDSSPREAFKMRSTVEIHGVGSPNPGELQSRAGSVRTDGWFVLPYSGTGNSRIDVTKLPIGLYLKSMSFAGREIQDHIVSVKEINNDPVLITLTTTSPNGKPGVRLSGRIIGIDDATVPAFVLISWAAPPSSVTPALSPVSLVRSYIPANRDRTFAVDHLQPGEYALTVGLSNENIMSALGQPLRVLIGDTSVTGIVLSGPPK